MNNIELNMEAYMPLRDVVFNALRDAILKGELKPGERLMELHLANKLGVSRTPIREAIRMLEQEGLAITIPRKGAQVAKMTEKDLEDVLEVRDALDELAVSSALRSMTPEYLESLDEALQAFNDAIKTGEVRDIVDADERFHNCIYEATGNPKLITIIQGLREQMYRYRYEYIKDNADYEQLSYEHAEIVKGLKEHNEGYVKEVMHTHLKNQVDSVRKLIEQQSDSVTQKK